MRPSFSHWTSNICTRVWSLRRDKLTRWKSLWPQVSPCGTAYRNIVKAKDRRVSRLRVSTWSCSRGWNQWGRTQERRKVWREDYDSIWRFPMIAQVRNEWAELAQNETKGYLDNSCYRVVSRTEVTVVQSYWQMLDTNLGFPNYQHNQLEP